MRGKDVPNIELRLLLIADLYWGVPRPAEGFGKFISRLTAIIGKGIAASDSGWTMSKESLYLVPWRSRAL